MAIHIIIEEREGGIDTPTHAMDPNHKETNQNAYEWIFVSGVWCAFSHMI